MSEFEQPAADGVVTDPVLGAALAELDLLADVEIGQHPDVYQRIHAELQTALTSIDDA